MIAETARTETGEKDAIRLVEISKRFGETQALQDVSLDLRPGHVHALLGQNGSGKSTLVKILASVYSPDKGHLSVRGETISWPWDPRDHGIAVIHQDLGLVEDISAVENFGAASRYGSRGPKLINWRRERELLEAYAERMAVSLNPRSLVRELRPSQRAMLAILRALRQLEESPSAGHGVLVLDEPTVYLPEHEKVKLGELIRSLAGQATAVLLINHDLKEVLGLADEMTILRDGQAVHHGETRGASPHDIARAMLGRSIERFYPAKRKRAPGAVTLQATEICGETVSDISLELRAGEIVGITGLAGMGQDELPYLLCGALTPKSGSVVRYSEDSDGGAGAQVRRRTSVASDVGLVPADRTGAGVWMDGSVAENVAIASLDHHSVFGFIQRRRERAAVAGSLESFGVVPPIPELPIRALSGGNQQKAVMARWFSDPRPVQILHEPSAGVDVAATHDLCEIVMKAADSGSSLLVSSIDYAQLAALCDRVLVLRNGRIICELDGERLTEEAIAHACQDLTP